MVETGEALMRAAEQVLAPQNAGELGFGGELEEFAQLACVCMGLWGYAHLRMLTAERRLHFLQLVGPLSQHPCGRKPVLTVQAFRYIGPRPWREQRYVIVNRSKDINKEKCMLEALKL